MQGLPLRTKLFFGSGSVAEGVKTSAFNIFLLYYFNNVLGLSGTLSGLAIFLALCVDAITDPLVGFLSDHTRSRWGRRHPYMYAAALPMAGSFYLLFDPPAGLSEMGLFAWLTSFAVAVRVSMTLYQIPSSSMIPELAPDYDERTSLVSYRFLFGWLGGLTAAVLGYGVYFAPTAEFETGLLNPDAYGGFAAMCSTLVALAILTCSAGTHRVIPQLREAPGQEYFTPKRFAQDVRQVLRSPSFRVLVVAALLASVAAGFNDVVGLYMNTYFWELSTDQLSLLVLSLGFSTAIAFALAAPLSRRYDKKRAALLITGVAIVLGPLPIFLRLAGWFPANHTPALFPLLVGHAVLVVTLVVAIGILFASMLADLTDENELATGRRQEGIFFSTVAFTGKAASGLGGLIAGVALDLVAFPRQAEIGAVAQEKVAALGLAVGPGLMILYVLTLLVLSRYRITREQHREILDAIGERRAI